MAGETQTLFETTLKTGSHCHSSPEVPTFSSRPARKGREIVSQSCCKTQTEQKVLLIEEPLQSVQWAGQARQPWEAQEGTVWKWEPGRNLTETEAHQGTAALTKVTQLRLRSGSPMCLTALQVQKGPFQPEFHLNGWWPTPRS